MNSASRTIPEKSVIPQLSCWLTSSDIIHVLGQGSTLRVTWFKLNRDSDTTTQRQNRHCLGGGQIANISSEQASEGCVLMCVWARVCGSLKCKGLKCWVFKHVKWHQFLLIFKVPEARWGVIMKKLYPRHCKMPPGAGPVEHNSSCTLPTSGEFFLFNPKVGPSRPTKSFLG